MVLKEGDLDGFSGSEEWFVHPFGLVYTEGVKYLCEEGGAYWLLDVIASYQPLLGKDPMLSEFQFWTLRVKEMVGEVTCVADSGYEPAIRQVIEYTDFPLEEVRLWVEHGVAPVAGRLVECMVVMLPGER